MPTSLALPWRSVQQMYVIFTIIHEVNMLAALNVSRLPDDLPMLQDPTYRTFITHEEGVSTDYVSKLQRSSLPSWARMPPSLYFPG